MTRFSLITAGDAHAFARGATVRLAAGGQVTPLALDVLRDRRITVLRADGSAADPSAVAPSLPLDAAEIAACLDHTVLRPDATRDAIDAACEEAATHGFATVCVQPSWVARAAARLRGGDVGVCAVAGFPHGAGVPEIKAREASAVLDAGATEVDMVLHLGALKGGDLAWLARDIRGVVAACRACGAVTKVILETALLSDGEKLVACRIAVDEGAAFVKTSTGFGPGGATTRDVALLARAVGGAAGVKAAGGIRTLTDARAMLVAGATRLGTSASVAIVAEAGECR
jgi:deoxyribose-phosphate aldolase